MALPPFHDNVAVVTGASSGIGRELALQLAGEGARVVLASRNAARLEEVADACRARGGRALVVPTDISDEQQCRNLMDRAVEGFGRIDTLINNAGWGVYGNFEDLPDLDAFRGVIETNFMGSVACTYHALPHLRERRGRVVAVSSLAGKMGLPGSTSYSASKFAMAGFFDALRVELMDSGVSVTVVYPGFVATEFAERTERTDGTVFGEAGRRFYSPRTMTAETCARRILKAAARRKRHLYMTLSGRVGMWMNVLVPHLLDRSLKVFGRKRTERYEAAIRQTERDPDQKGTRYL